MVTSGSGQEYSTIQHTNGSMMGNDDYDCGNDDIDDNGDSKVCEDQNCNNTLYTNSQNQETTPNINYETFHRQPTPSKFIFLSDKKSVPTDLKKLQETTMKRRRDYVARMHDLDCHTARLMSKYAEERMDLDLATCDTFERSVIHPLETAVERLAIDREASTTRSANISAMERRIGRLDAQMTRHIYVTMSDDKLDKLDSIQDNLQQNIASEIRIENSKYNKIEGGIVQRFELATGNITRNIHSEGATRQAAIELLTRKVDKTIPERAERAEITLSQIANLRAQLKEERIKRQAADVKIYDDITHKTAALKRAMIAMVSDGDSSNQ